MIRITTELQGSLFCQYDGWLLSVCSLVYLQLHPMSGISYTVHIVYNNNYVYKSMQQINALHHAIYIIGGSISLTQQREYITDFSQLFHRSQAAVIQSGCPILPVAFLLIQLHVYSATACPEAASQVEKTGKS